MIGRSSAGTVIAVGPLVDRITEILPDILGAAQLVSSEGGWETLSTMGELDVQWALRVLRAGEAPLFDELDGSTEEVEAVMTNTQSTQVVVADARGAVVLNLARGTNLGLALGFAHGVVRNPAP